MRTTRRDLANSVHALREEHIALKEEQARQAEIIREMQQRLERLLLGGQGVAWAVLWPCGLICSKGTKRSEARAAGMAMMVAAAKIVCLWNRRSQNSRQQRWRM